MQKSLSRILHFFRVLFIIRKIVKFIKINEILYAIFISASISNFASYMVLHRASGADRDLIKFFASLCSLLIQSQSN